MIRIQVKKVIFDSVCKKFESIKHTFSKRKKIFSFLESFFVFFENFIYELHHFSNKYAQCACLMHIIYWQWSFQNRTFNIKQGSRRHYGNFCSMVNGFLWWSILYEWVYVNGSMWMDLHIYGNFVLWCLLRNLNF